MRGGGECAVTGAQRSSSPHLHAHAPAPAPEGKPVRHSIISQLDSLLALSTTHGWWPGVRFLLLPAQPPACDDEHPRRRCRRRYHHRSLTASAPASVCRCSACTRADSCRQHMCPLLLQCLRPPLPHTPFAHPSPGSSSSKARASTHAKRCRQAHFVAHLPCRHHRRSPHPQSLSARSSECACS